MNLLLITILLFLPVCGLFAQAVDIKEKSLEYYQPKIHFNSAVWKNPAIKYDMFSVSITSVSIGGALSENSGAYIAQEGHSDKKFDFYAESFLKINENTRLYGYATYVNGHKDAVSWNETADFALIYPYVTADSVGGFMDSEEYRFSGGYITRLGEWTIGAELDYRALISYRDVDPRPRNVVSDLSAKIGTSRSVGKYKLGLSFIGRTYKQNSSMIFKSDKGNVPVYHMMGLGVNYVRFFGEETSSNYSGYEFGGSVDLLPDDYYGFNVSLGMKYLNIVKSLPSINYAPIAEIDETNFTLDASWMKKGERLEYGIMINTKMLKREGTEIILGAPSGSEYPIISESTKFHSPFMIAKISAIIGSRILNNTWSWNVIPHVSYMKINPSNISVNRYIESSSMTTGLKFNSLWQMRKFLISANLGFDYTSNLSSDYSLTGLNLGSSVAKSITSNISILSDSFSKLTAGFALDYFINKKYAIAIILEYIQQKHNVNGLAHFGRVNMVFKF